MTVRAKFKAQSISRIQGWDGQKMVEQHSIRMVPVTSGSEENKKFYEATPSGEMSLSVVNKAVADLFTPGAEYYLDITPA